MNMNQLVLGPLLGLEGESRYTVCFVTAPAILDAHVVVDGKTVPAMLVDTVYSGKFWRAAVELPVPGLGQQVSYRIELDGRQAISKSSKTQWAFYQPGEKEDARLAYGCCNGFSDLKLMNNTKRPYALWEQLLAMHDAAPFSALLLGGDQVYADSAWTVLPTLREWNALPLADKLKRKATKPMLEQLDRFYCELYCERWQQTNLAHALASIPNVMMWDDHDIIDGWGSFPAELQQCEVFNAIYKAAARHFELFQLRGRAHNSSLIGQQHAGHYSLGVSFRGHTVLALDNRSERTIAQVMSPGQWTDVVAFLNKVTQGDLLVMTAVPVVYRDFSFVENTFDATPWEEELSDDLKDHWRAREHQGERARLIMHLLANARKRQGRTVILSGDVHVGCLGIVKDTTEPGTTVNLHQVVSSGMVHPAPTQIQWMGILATTNDRSEKLDENGRICIDMLQAFGAGTYFRTRNFATLEKGSDQKLWVNWVCENGENPVYPLN